MFQCRLVSLGLIDSLETLAKTIESCVVDSFRNEFNHIVVETSRIREFLYMRGGTTSQEILTSM